MAKGKKKRAKKVCGPSRPGQVKCIVKWSKPSKRKICYRREHPSLMSGGLFGPAKKGKKGRLVRVKCKDYPKLQCKPCGRAKKR